MPIERETLDARHRGTFPQLGHPALKDRPEPFGIRLNTTVGQISDPPAKTESYRGVLYEKTEANTLHPTGNDQMRAYSLICFAWAYHFRAWAGLGDSPNQPFS